VDELAPADQLGHFREGVGDDLDLLERIEGLPANQPGARSLQARRIAISRASGPSS
jgi:hypothetical protein